MSSASLAIIFGLTSALIWGSADFCGGLAARRTRVTFVVFFSQLIGGLLLTAAALSLGRPLPGASDMLPAMAAGLLGALGLLAFYTALARGRMGLIAPVSAMVAALVPLAVSWQSEGLPGNIQLIGFCLAFVSVWLLSRNGSGSADKAQAQLPLALLSGIGFGFFFALIGQISHQAILWPLVGARLASVSLFGLLLFIPANRASSTGLSGLPWLMIFLAGLFDSAGNTFFALAASHGRLDIAAVLGSLYPGSTVVLAWLVLKERLSPGQWLGAALALFALILIAA